VGVTILDERGINPSPSYPCRAGSRLFLHRDRSADWSHIVEDFGHLVGKTDAAVGIWDPR